MSYTNADVIEGARAVYTVFRELRHYATRGAVTLPDWKQLGEAEKHLWLVAVRGTLEEFEIGTKAGGEL